MKKICNLFVLLIMIFGFSVTVNANSGTCGTGVKWSYSGSTLTISGSGAMKDYTALNPPPWEDYLSNILTVKIEEGVTRIGDRAFNCAMNLRHVYMAKSVKTIGDYAFAWTLELESMGLGKGVTTLETYVFDESSLHNIEIPKSVTKIGKNCFTNENSEINYGLENVYYEGSGLDWENINIASGNDALSASGCNLFTNQQLALKMSLSNTSVSLSVGSSQVITARNWENVGLNSLSVKWTSSNPSVATVSIGGITGKSAGTATITASYHGYTATCHVTVTSTYVEPEKPVEPEIVLSYIDYSNSTIKIGETTQLRAVSTSGNYMSGVTWSSSHTGIATVSSSGVVTGKSTGSVTITAGYNGRYVTTTIYVIYSINFNSMYVYTNEWNYSEIMITYDYIYQDYTASVYVVRTDLNGSYKDAEVYHVNLPAYSSETILRIPQYSLDGYIYLDIGVENSNDIYLGRLQTDERIYKVLRDVDGYMLHITGYDTADICNYGYDCYSDDWGYAMCIPDYIEGDGEFYYITGICDDAYSGYGYETLIIPESIKKIGKNVCDGYLDKIYYMGSLSQWCDIDIDGDNEYLNNANIRYNYVGCNVPLDGFMIEPKHSDGMVSLSVYVRKAYKDCTAIVEIRNQELDKLQAEYRFNVKAGTDKEYPVFIPLRPDDKYHKLFVRYELNGVKCGETSESSQFYAERPIFYENGIGYKNFEDEYAGVVEYIGTEENVVIPETLGGLPVVELQWLYSSRIKTLTIPSTLKYLKEYILMECKNLRSVYISEDNQYFCDIDGVVFTKDKKTMICCPPGREGETYTIPYGTEIIETGAIAETKLKEIILPDTVKCINDGGLSKASMERVFIPASVEEIGDYAFGYDLNLEEIKVSEDNPYYSDIDGVLCSKDGTTLYQYPGAKKLHTYVIPESFTEIGEGAFEMTFIKTLYIPKTVEKIGEYALNSEFKCIFYEGTEEEFHNRYEQYMIGGYGAKWLYGIDCEDVIIGSVGSHYLDGKVKVKVDYDYLTKPGVCYVAIYDGNNRMIAADKAIVGLDADVTTFEFDADSRYVGYTVKAMLWDEDGNVSPVADSIDGSVKKSIVINHVIESDHPCTMGYNSYWYEGEGESIDITFSKETDAGEMGNITIMTQFGAKYFGKNELAGKTINIKGNMINIDCYTNGKEAYGYKVEKIVVNP